MLNSAFFLWIVFGILSISLIIQLIYYLNFYRATVRYEGENTDNSIQPSVSVIICSRNEEKNLKEFLPAILEQDYPDYEVIVVNDCSEDNT
ncbi:MAG: glycosyltransferase, partial [Bacteroidales bacterium]|nr:glycosyltransferase [Bacteroidales bacterium]